MKTTKWLKTGLIPFIVFGALCCSCQKDLLEYQTGDLKVTVKSGDEWTHPYDLFLGLKKNNPPQIAIWVEDMNGNYLETIYASHKAGTNSWQGNGGDLRREALPYWNYSRLTNLSNTDGSTGATTPKPVLDAVTGATPKSGFDIKVRPTQLTRFIIKAEFNHSKDWNEYYPKSAKAGDSNYTKESGQPAVIYQAEIDLTSGAKTFTAQLIGHSSIDGSNGDLYTNIAKLTTAQNIVKEITITIED